MKAFKKILKIKIKLSIIILLLFIFFIVLFFIKITEIQKVNIKNQDNNSNQKRVLVESITHIPSKDEAKINDEKKDPQNQYVLAENTLKVPILFYHYVGNNPNPKDVQRDALSVSPDKFEEQMKYLKDNGYNSISLDTLYAALKKQTALPSKPVVLTFDDGYIDFYYNAYNILRSYGLSATVFVPTGLVGQPAYLTWPQIKEMQSSGLINFGSHTVHHYNLPSTSKDTTLNELAESKKVLQEQLGVPINFICYPNGATNSSIIGLVQTTGYVGAVGTWPNSYQSEKSIYNMPRLRISGAVSIGNFAKLLQ